MIINTCRPMVKLSRAETKIEADGKEIHPKSPSLTYYISKYFTGYPEVFPDKMRCVVLRVVLVLPLGFQSVLVGQC